MLEQAAERIRRLVESRRPAGSTEPFPRAVRREVVGFALEARREEWPWRRIAAAVGLGLATLHRWARDADSASLVQQRSLQAVPVEVVGQEEPPVEVVGQEEPPVGPAPSLLTLVSPRGFRLEGLSLAAAAQLMEALG